MRCGVEMGQAKQSMGKDFGQDKCIYVCMYLFYVCVCVYTRMSVMGQYSRS